MQDEFLKIKDVDNTFLLFACEFVGNIIGSTADLIVCCIFFTFFFHSLIICPLSVGIGTRIFSFVP